MTMFEGDTPLKIRLADTGKLLGTHCLNHPAPAAGVPGMAGQ